MKLFYNFSNSPRVGRTSERNGEGCAGLSKSDSPFQRPGIGHGIAWVVGKEFDEIWRLGRSGTSILVVENFISNASRVDDSFPMRYIVVAALLSFDIMARDCDGG